MPKEFVVYRSGRVSTWVTRKINETRGTHYLYVLECVDHKFYCGITANVIRRLTDHLSDNGSCFTRRNKPINLVHLEKVGKLSDAIDSETEMNMKIRNNQEINFFICDEFVGLFQIIQELLLTNERQSVIDRLKNIQNEEV